MSPIIRISRSNWERIKRFAVPLEDSTDDALNRILDTAERSSNERIPGKRHDNERAGDEVQSPRQTEEAEIENENRLLLVFEHWLSSLGPRVKLMHRKKTMATWRLETADGKQRNLFVPTNGLNKLYLPVADYVAFDQRSKIVRKNYRDDKTGKLVGWNYYPQLDVKTPDDLEFAKRLVDFVLGGDKAQDGRLMRERRAHILFRLSERYRTVPQGISMVDELIEERRAEALRERTGC